MPGLRCQIFLAVALLGLACADDIDAPSLDLGGKSDLATDASGYYHARLDARKCASPLCGGLFLSAANQYETVCADGESRAECYVAPVDFEALGLSTEQRAILDEQLAEGTALVRGTLVPMANPFQEDAVLGSLELTGVWTAGVASDEVSSSLYRVASSGIRCITFPCPTVTSRLLGSDADELVAGLDFSGLGLADEAESALVIEAMSNGMIVAGHAIEVTGPAGSAEAMAVDQYYVELVAATCPDPADPNVEYASEDPQVCTAILFACEEGEELFSDECGCGCVAN